MYKRSYLRRKVVKLSPVNEGASVVPGPGIRRIKVGRRTVASARLAKGVRVNLASGTEPRSKRAFSRGEVLSLASVLDSAYALVLVGVGIREEGNITGSKVSKVGKVRYGKQE